MAASTLRMRPWCLIFSPAGTVNVTIIKFSVDGWSTSHQLALITLTDAPLLFVPANCCGLVFAAIIVTQLPAAVMQGRARGLLLARADAEFAGAVCLVPYAAGVLMRRASLPCAWVRLTHAEASLAASHPRVARMGKHGERS